MESPGNHDVAPALTSLGSRDDNNNMAYARRCVVMEIIKAETDYVTHLHDVVQVKTINHTLRRAALRIELQPHWLQQAFVVLVKAVAVLGKNIWGAWPLIIWEATTAKRNLL